MELTKKRLFSPGETRVRVDQAGHKREWPKTGNRGRGNAGYPIGKKKKKRGGIDPRMPKLFKKDADVKFAGGTIFSQKEAETNISNIYRQREERGDRSPEREEERKKNLNN